VNNPLFKELIEEIFERPSLIQDVFKTFTKRPTTFRVNSHFHDHLTTVNSLKSQGFKLEKHPMSEFSFILKNKSKRELMETQEYLNSKIYLQSLASQAPVIALKPKPGKVILDLTAAPGSKTSQIANLMKKQGNLYAVEINKPRFFKLSHNMKAQGFEDPEFLKLELTSGVKFCKTTELKFDYILLDAPCSAESRFDFKEPKTYKFWSRHKIKENQSKQKKLLKGAFEVLKPNGTLVYSTCTMNLKENELQISDFLKKHPNAKLKEIQIQGLKKHNLSDDLITKYDMPQDINKCFRLMPDNNVEGFFLAKIVKS